MMEEQRRIRLELLRYVNGSSDFVSKEAAATLVESAKVLEDYLYSPFRNQVENGPGTLADKVDQVDAVDAFTVCRTAPVDNPTLGRGDHANHVSDELGRRNLVIHKDSPVSGLDTETVGNGEGGVNLPSPETPL